MRKCRRIMAVLMSLLMIIGLIGVVPITVKAEDGPPPPIVVDNGDIRIDIVNGQNGVVSYKIGDGEWQEITANPFTLRKTNELNGVAEGTAIYLRAVPNSEQSLDAHDLQNRINNGESDAQINIEDLKNGSFNVGYDSTKGYLVQIKFEGGGGPAGGSGGDPGPQVNPGDISINIVNGQNGKVSYKIGEGGWNEITANPFTLRRSDELKDLADDTAIYFKAEPNSEQSLDAHELQNRIDYGEGDKQIDTSALASGAFNVVYDSGKNYSIQIKFEGGGQPGGGPGPIVDPENITVTVTTNVEHFFVPGNNEIKVDNIDAKAGTVTVQQKDKHVIRLQVEFGSAVSKIIVNGNEYIPIKQAEDWYSVEVDDATSYSIALVQGVSDDVSLVWAYDKDYSIEHYGNEDAWVENGRVELLSITRAGSVIFDSETHVGDPAAFGIDENGGSVFLKKGDDVTMRLIPDYGYQLASVNINGVDELKPEANVSTFTIDNIQGNIHFRGVFEQASDKIDNHSDKVNDASIADGQNAAGSGNLKLTINNNDSYTKDLSSCVDGNIEKIGSLDMSLDNIVSKGTENNYWEENITSFTDDINISMDINVDFSQLKDDEQISVIRDHGGVLEELPVFVDKQNGIIEFPTNKFSTYTIIKKQPKEGDVVYSFDIECGEKDCFLRNDANLNDAVFRPTTGDIWLIYFGKRNSNSEGELKDKFDPIGLLKDNGYELADNVSIQYSADTAAWADANYSIAFSEWDGLTDADIRIRSVKNGVHELAFCRVGFYKFTIDGKEMIFETMPKPLMLEHDQAAPGYYYNTYIYDKNNSFTIKPAPDVTNYSVYIDARFGYGVDGNNIFFTGNKAGTDVTDKLHYIHEEDDWDYIDKDGGFNFGNEEIKLNVTDVASSYATIFIKYTNGYETWIDSYQVNYSITGIRDSDSKRKEFNKKAEPQAFECYAISKEEYNENSVDYFMDSDLYVSYGQTMAEALDVMVEQMNAGTVPKHDYLLIRTKVTVNNSEEVELSKQPQYVSTPSDVKGVVLTCQEMDYVVKVSNSFDSVNGGNDIEEWLGYAGPLDENDNTNPLRYFIHKNGPGTAYYEVVGDIDTGDFAIKNGIEIPEMDENGMPYIEVEGVKYCKPENKNIEYKLPEMHVDATTEIHLIGSFMEYDNDQPSIFMNIPEGSPIESIINGDSYTSNDLDKIFNKTSEFKSWAFNEPITSSYTVKVGKLETKTTFAGTTDSEVKSVKSEVDVDSLFDQLTGSGSILSAAEQSAVGDGKNITITLDVNAVDNTQSTALANEVSKSYADSELQYLDIDLLYHVGFDGAADKNITETNSDVKISVGLDDGFVDSDSEYVILREHNGVVEELTATLNADGTLDFGTDKFSSYVIVKKAKNDQDGGSSGGSGPSGDGGSNGGNGSSGDGGSPDGDGGSTDGNNTSGNNGSTGGNNSGSSNENNNSSNAGSSDGHSNAPSTDIVANALNQNKDTANTIESVLKKDVPTVDNPTKDALTDDNHKKDVPTVDIAKNDDKQEVAEADDKEDDKATVEDTDSVDEGNKEEKANDSTSTIVDKPTINIVPIIIGLIAVGAIALGGAGVLVFSIFFKRK